MKKFIFSLMHKSMCPYKIFLLYLDAVVGLMNQKRSETKATFSDLDFNSDENHALRKKSANRLMRKTFVKTNKKVSFV